MDGKRLFHLAHLLHDPVEIEGELAVIALGDLGEHLHPAEDVKLALKLRRTGVEQAQLARHTPDVVLLDDLLGRDVPALI